jgi:hypothetical protein
MWTLMRRYTDSVANVRAEHAFKASFDFVWDVLHHSTNKCISSTVHRSVAATKRAGDGLNFARTICITLDLNLDLWHLIQ